jgi:hypothetical protein
VRTAAGREADRVHQEVVRSRTEAERIHTEATEQADGIRTRAESAAEEIRSRAHQEAERVRQLAATEAESERRAGEEARVRVTELAEEYLQRATETAKGLQEQAQQELKTASAVRLKAEQTKATAEDLKRQAEQAMADATNPTVIKLQKKKLKREDKEQQRKARQAAKTADERTLTWVHWTLVTVIIVGAAVIGAIGFTGSYQSVRDLAKEKGFGDFADVLPIGADAGIVVFLAFDLLLTWLRMPLPLLRHAAWGLTLATVWFNASASWGDPVAVGMHTVMPMLFVLATEGGRHAVAHIAAINNGDHIESVRMERWLLALPSTARLWRRMKIWEIHKYKEALKQEQARVLYRDSLKQKYGRGWRREATPQELRPLTLSRYGVEITETGAVVRPDEADETTQPKSRETSRGGTGRSRETSAGKSRETSKTAEPKSRETKSRAETETSETDETRSRETSNDQDETKSRETGETKTSKVTSLEDVHTEIQQLLDLMWERGGADTVKLGSKKNPGEAETITGRPHSTAYKRLQDARDLFNAGRRHVIETSDETRTAAATGTDN